MKGRLIHRPTAKHRIAPPRVCSAKIKRHSRQLHLPGCSRILKRPMPDAILSPHESHSIGNLRKILDANSYTPRAKKFIEKAYAFSENLYQGKRRDDGTHTITHPLAVAVRAAKMRLSEYAVCAALLHDSIEDTNRTKNQPGQVLPDHILNLFGENPPARRCGEETLKTVLLLTKPKYLDRPGTPKNLRWISPDNKQYFSINDDYQQCYKRENYFYDERSRIYYDRLLNSGNIVAIVLKELDNIHNAETMKGISREKIMKNLRTMGTNTLQHAGIFFVEKDVQYIKGLFRDLGVTVDLMLTPARPRSEVISFKLRDRIDLETLVSHPDPQYTYISLYGSIPEVALMLDYVEIGLPPRLGLNYKELLNIYFNGDFLLEEGKSVVPSTSPVNEHILRVGGFLDQKTRNKVLRPSDEESGYFELLGYGGEVVTRATLHGVKEGDVKLGEPTREPLKQVKQQYHLLNLYLCGFYQDVLVPILEKMDINKSS
ncbi:HD domain-containing protein [Candidatus Micrarchaeota archaeon]|nr:HD domain-containing protein [Candidatus Micrarchaeota archaeon]